ncbi:MAG: hypothetical protein KGQ75_16810 [Sphingomonadales bacterium]|nr:hypothetical protein [Sphingomonadales bacterium]
MKHILFTVIAVLIALVGESFVMGAAPVVPANQSMRATIDGRRWFIAQFRATVLKPDSAAAMQPMLARIGALPFAREHAVIDPMVEVLTLAKANNYQDIADQDWAPVDRLFDQALAAGLPRIMVTLVFKLDPTNPVLAQYCALQEHAEPNGSIVSRAIANGSCLPQYANPDYQAMVVRLTAIAVRHFERRFGGAVIGYEPAGGVAGEIDWKGTDARGNPVFGDVSPSMLVRYREKLQGAVGSTPLALAMLSKRRGARFNSWSDVRPLARGNLHGPEGGGTFAGILGTTFAQARYDVMRDFYARLHQTVSSNAPTKLFSLRMGAILDPTAVLRGTIYVQQFANDIRPDLMASDASTFNHLYEGPVIAPTIYHEGAYGTGVKWPNAAMWMTFADRFATYDAKRIDYKRKITQQIRDSFDRNGFRAMGFYMNPVEIVQHPEYVQFLASLAPFFNRTPVDIMPRRFVDVPLRQFIDQPNGQSSYVAMLRAIKGATGNFQDPVAVRFTTDPTER